MNRNRLGVWCAVSILLHGLFLPAAFGHSDRSGYGEILDHNVFRLKAPEMRTVDVSPQPLPNVKLTGITTLFARKLALLKVRLPGKGTEAGQELAVNLEEGQGEHDLQIVRIDEKGGRVELLHCGTPMFVAFEINSPAPVAAPDARPLLLRTLSRGGLK